jgi:hypothetical protein
MALTLTLWVSVEERDAAGATREVQEAMKIHAEFDDNTVDGLKGGLAKKLQRLQGQRTGEFKLYLKSGRSFPWTEWTKLEPDWPVLPEPMPKESPTSTPAASPTTPTSSSCFLPLLRVVFGPPVSWS